MSGHFPQNESQSDEPQPGNRGIAMQERASAWLRPNSCAGNDRVAHAALLGPAKRRCRVLSARFSIPAKMITKTM